MCDLAASPGLTALNEGFPLVTTRTVHLRFITQELLWFLTASSDNNSLRKRGVTMWDEWAAEDCELGPVYGVQRRSCLTPDGGPVDQIAQVIDTLKTNPGPRTDRRCAAALPAGDGHPCAAQGRRGGARPRRSLYALAEQGRDRLPRHLGRRHDAASRGRLATARRP